VPRTPKLPRGRVGKPLPAPLAVANRDTLAPIEEVALAPIPYPSWTAEQQRRREAKGRVFDRALGKIERLLEQRKKIDPQLLVRIARDMDPDRLVIKGASGGTPAVQIVFVVEGQQNPGLLYDESGE